MILCVFGRKLKKELIRLNEHIKIVEHERNELKSKVNFIDKRIGDLDNYYLSESSREHRIHPYINDALNFLKLKNEDNYVLVEMLSESKFHNQLENLLLKYGSDKNTRHSYARFYENIIYEFKVNTILEIGIGSESDHKYASGTNGGSIKAFREFIPNGTVIAADVDHTAINSVEEPKYWVDQTKLESLNDLQKFCMKFGHIDLIVDDGFHDLHANLYTFQSLSNLLSEHGIYIIEDVHSNLIPIWLLLGEYLNLNLKIFDMRPLRPQVEDNILLMITKNNKFNL